jgi:hypothetical protein
MYLSSSALRLSSWRRQVASLSEALVRGIHRFATALSLPVVWRLVNWSHKVTHFRIPANFPDQ